MENKYHCSEVKHKHTNYYIESKYHLAFLESLRKTEKNLEMFTQGKETNKMFILENTHE